MSRLIRSLKQWPPLQLQQYHHHCCSRVVLTISTKFPSHRFSFATSTNSSSSRGNARHRPCGGIKSPNAPSRSNPKENETDDDSESDSKKSRNEKKREARRAVRWGIDLASFSTPQIKRILRVAALEPEVFDALMLVKRLGPDVREGKRRQINYIGKLLREVEPELMEALIQATKVGEQEDEDVDDDDQFEYSEIINIANRWFDGLISKDIEITNEVFSVTSVDFDRQNFVILFFNFKIFMDLSVSSGELMSIFVPIIVYWIYSGMYVILESFEKYKLHSKKEEVEKNLVSRRTVIKGVLLQQTIQAAVVFLMLKVTGQNDAGAEPAGQPSSFIIMAIQFIVAMLVLDTYQYFSHRYMHHNKFLYRRFHSYHHRLVVPYSFGALYSHQLDGLLFDTIGGSLAILLSGMSPRTSIYFSCFAVIKAIDDHCGILMPGNPFHILFWNNTAFHDTHHQLHGSKYNFSQPFFIMWDRIMGTYMPYSLEKRAEGGYESRLIREINKDD